MLCYKFIKKGTHWVPESHCFINGAENESLKYMYRLFIKADKRLAKSNMCLNFGQILWSSTWMNFYAF